MNTEQIPQTNSEKPTLSQLWQAIKKYKKLYYKVLGITFIVSALITLSIPNYYKCTVRLAPELSGSSTSTSSLASLASSFGIKLGTGTTGSEALFPTLYPDLMNSVSFRASLFPITIHKEDEDSLITYYDYLNEYQHLPWWTASLKWVFDGVSSFFTDEEVSDKIDPFKLTKEQYYVVKDMEDRVVCDVDKKTLVITIEVTDQDPLIAATMADSVQMHLQEFITEYRTRKARIDLGYNLKLFADAKTRYESSRIKYASYADANRNVLFENRKSEITKLENEMNLQYQAYSQVAAQLRMAEAKVQEDTPAFTLLQPATVPVKKSGPKRGLLCLICLFLSFVFTTIYILNKEDNLSSLLSILERNANHEVLANNEEEYYILSKHTPKMK